MHMSYWRDEIRCFCLFFLSCSTPICQFLIRGYKGLGLCQYLNKSYFLLNILNWSNEDFMLWNSNDKNLEYCELPSIRFWKIKLNDSNYCHKSSFFGTPLVPHTEDEVKCYSMESVIIHFAWLKRVALGQKMNNNKIGIFFNKNTNNEDKR